jgi:hypothetical protein
MNSQNINGSGLKPSNDGQRTSANMITSGKAILELTVFYPDDYTPQMAGPTA